MTLTRIRDKLWIRQSFLLPANSIDDAAMRRRQMSTASFKFVDTTLGGNFAINAPPSYSRFADPRMGGRLGEAGMTTPEVAFMHSTGRFRTTENADLSDSSYIDEIEEQLTSRSSGMGSYYSEAIDDNNQIVIMRFGVPAYNSLTTFFGQFYSQKAAAFARMSRADNSGNDGILSSMIIKATGAAGSAFGMMLALPFQPIIFAGNLFRFLAGAPPSKYYYLKPAMFPYWAAVQNIVNLIGVNLGIVPHALTENQRTVYEPDNTSADFGPGDYEKYHAAMPDIISANGFIDVYAMGTKAQRRANRYNSALLDGMEGQITSLTQLAGVLGKVREVFRSGQNQSGQYEGRMFGDYVEAVAGEPQYQPAASDASAPTGASPPPDGGGGEGGPSAEDLGFASEVDNGEQLESAGDRSQWSWGSKLWDFAQGEARDGANFVSFRVDYTGPTQESFSNEVGESGIAQKINSISASSRSTRFDFADGNLGMGVGTIVDAVKGFVANTLDRVQLSGLTALAGSAFVDIPQVWQSATAQMPTASFTMQLRSPYANRLAQMQNLYIPLAMILAAGLPHMAGKKSYKDPFLVELYCKGRVNIRMGIIDSITISRGEGNVGWNQEGRALGIDVTFSVKDLTTVMSMPLTTQFSSTAALVQGAVEGVAGETAGNVAAALQKSMYDDDNAFTDYMAALGSLGFQDMVYAFRKWRINRIRLQRSVDEMKSPAMWSSFLVNATVPGRIWNAVALETDRSSTGM